LEILKMQSHVLFVLVIILYNSFGWNFIVNAL